MYGFNAYPNYQTNFNQPLSQPVTQDERIWVQNETSAEAYLVAPNGFVRLWDSSKPIFYEKRADATGRPMPMEMYEYTKIASNRGLGNADEQCAINERIDGLIKRIEALEEGMNESNADNTTVQSVQKSVPRRSTKGSTEADC